MAVRSHGRTKTRTYRIWSAMHSRCKNQLKYVMEGITVCRRWRVFQNFYDDMGDPPSDKHSLDRKDNRKGYSPSNCRWATKIEQNNNTSRNKWPGRQVRQEALAAGIPPETIYSRLKLGYTLDEALSLEPYQRSPRIQNTKTQGSRDDDNRVRRKDSSRRHDGHAARQAPKPEVVRKGRAKSRVHVRDHRHDRKIS